MHPPPPPSSLRSVNLSAKRDPTDGKSLPSPPLVLARKADGQSHGARDSGQWWTGWAPIVSFQHLTSASVEPAAMCIQTPPISFREDPSCFSEMMMNPGRMMRTATEMHSGTDADKKKNLAWKMYENMDQSSNTAHTDSSMTAVLDDVTLPLTLSLPLSLCLPPAQVFEKGVKFKEVIWNHLLQICFNHDWITTSVIQIQEILQMIGNIQRPSA